MHGADNKVFEVNADGSAGLYLVNHGALKIYKQFFSRCSKHDLYPNFNAYNADDPFWSNGEM